MWEAECMVLDLHHKINGLIGQLVIIHKIDSLAVTFGEEVNRLEEIKCTEPD